MGVASDFVAWLKGLFRSGGASRRIDAHLAALAARRQTYEDQRREFEGALPHKEEQRDQWEARLRVLVDRGEQHKSEAIRLGHDLDAVREEITDLMARARNRRAFEALLRRVISAGEELKAFLPQEPHMATELESNLAQLVQQAQAENAEALGQLLGFLEKRLARLKEVQVRVEPVTEREAGPESIRQLEAEKEAKQRAEPEAAKADLETTDQDARAAAEKETPAQQEQLEEG